MFECMLCTLGGWSRITASIRGVLESAQSEAGPWRSVESPSIESTADGVVGFCTVTGQQFEDFLLLVGRPDLIGDERFATAVLRARHQNEFEAIVQQWTSKRSTEEILEAASLLRIPVAPVGTPETVPAFEQFVAREAFVDSPGGGFFQPRPPIRIHGVAATRPRRAPTLGQDGGDMSWRHAGAAGSPDGPLVVPGSTGRPLEGVKVIDLTAFWAGPAATQMLAALGADVVKVESPSRPDGMRFNSRKGPGEARWWEWGPIFQSVNIDKRGVTLDLRQSEGRDVLLELIGQADVVVENFSPRVLEDFGLNFEVIARANPRAIMVRMPAFGLDGPWRDRTGFAQTVEQISGMAWRTGFPDGLPVIPRGPCDPLGGMHAVVGLLCALQERERSGVGRLVEVALAEAALNAAAEVVIEHSAYGESLHRKGNRSHEACPQGVYRCRGEERWLALAVVTDAQWSALVETVRLAPWAGTAELATAKGRRGAEDRIDAELAAALADRDLHVVVEALLAVGVPAAPVVSPFCILDNEHLRARGFPERIEHPVVGTHEFTGIPFRFDTVKEPWFRHGAPTLGQHNTEVLCHLGLSGAHLDRLQRAGVISEGLRTG